MQIYEWDCQNTVELNCFISEHLDKTLKTRKRQMGLQDIRWDE